MNDEESPSGANSVDLVRLAQAGDEVARDLLFARFYGRVLRVVRARLGPQLRTTVESGDLVHEALLQAIRSFDRFEIRDPDGLIAWFARIVENRIRATAKFQLAEKRDRRREVALPGPASADADQAAWEAAAGGPSPASEVAQAEQLRRLEAAIAGLDPPAREVIRSRETLGMSWSEVAETHGFASSDAARMFYARTLIRLKKALGAGESTDEQPDRPDAG